MGKTFETMVVSDPSPRIIEALEKMRRHKAAQLERLRNLDHYNYEIKIK